MSVAMVVAAVGVWLLVLAAVCRWVGVIERKVGANCAAIRKDVAALHAAHEYARVEHLRILTDVETASITASNEVRMAAGTVRAVTDILVGEPNGDARVAGR